MQDKFVADEGDFGKYGLLRTLAGIEPKAKPRYRLGIIWYFGDDGEPHDADLDYLSETREFRHFDKELFRHLQHMDEMQTRTVEEVKKQGFLRRRRFLGRNTVFFADDVPDGQGRDGWLSLALETTRKTDIVFLDPDNGLATPKMEAKDRRLRTHTYLDEVMPLVARRQTVVVYQSYRRGDGYERKEELRKWRDERLAELDLFERPRVVGTSKRAFVVLPASHHVEHIDRRLRGFLTRWGNHFKHQAL